jgi:hypothetical protein
MARMCMEVGKPASTGGRRSKGGQCWCELQEETAAPGPPVGRGEVAIRHWCGPSVRGAYSRTGVPARVSSPRWTRSSRAPNGYQWVTYRRLTAWEAS